MIACGRALGCQKSDCLSDGVSGSLGKSHPPPAGESVQLVIARSVGAVYSEKLATVILVAAQILPSEAGGRNTSRIPVVRR